jgi:hypothetical protein
MNTNGDDVQLLLVVVCWVGGVLTATILAHRSGR